MCLDCAFNLSIKESNMLKLFIIALIVIGGYTIASHFFPQIVAITLGQVGGFTISVGLLLMIALGYTGIKTVH